ncbi:MAG TPA: D-glycero-beta-D-manno-heptose-7-phosphate kinase [bacterium]|jgi:rfaE bifunctional protein kinase chain/domain|nr:D-glycero-beta-D-manno-heptose-7-phosphate kinase [bacterium]
MKKKSILSSVDQTELLALVGLLRNKKVVVIGDVMLDVYIKGEVARISPEAPIPVVEINEDDKKMPGGAANVAANITALGGKSSIIGTIGKDVAGKELLKELTKLKVNTSGILALSDRPTTEKTRVIANTQQVVRIDREVKTALSDKQQDQVIQKALAAIRDADGVIFEDYNKGLLTSKVIRKAIAYAKAKKKIITVDPKFHNFFEFKGVTVMKPNMKEVTEALGPEAVGKTFETIGFKVMERLGCKSVVLTRSEHGMTLFEPNLPPRTIPTVAREVYDVSGAGDTVIATLTLALTAGASLFQAAALANYAAGIEVEKLGVATVSAEELSQRLLEEMNR